MRFPGNAQFKGQKTATSSNPSHPWDPKCTERRVKSIAFIGPQIGQVAGYFNVDLRSLPGAPLILDEQKGCFRRLKTVKVKVNRKKSLPALARGQLWKTDNAYIQIVDLGKRLIDYRMMRQLGQSRRTQTSSIETMENYLRKNEARLIKGNSRN